MSKWVMQVKRLRKCLIGLLCLSIGVLPSGAAFAHALPLNDVTQAQPQRQSADATAVEHQATAVKDAAVANATRHTDCHKAAETAGPAKIAGVTIKPAASDTGSTHHNCCPEGKTCSGLCLSKCAQVLGIVAPSVRHALRVATHFVDGATRVQEGLAIRPAPPPPRT